MSAATEQASPDVLAALVELRADFEAMRERLERRVSDLEQRWADREDR